MVRETCGPGGMVFRRILGVLCVGGPMSVIRSVPVLRTLAWRLGRKIYCAARDEAANVPSQNGEYWLLSKVLGRAGASTASVILDVRANKGDWSAEAARLSQGSEVLIHAFEPSTPTREILSSRLSDVRGLRVHSCALSDSDGESVFYSSEPGAGTSSLHDVCGPKKEIVRMRRLDTLLVDERIDAVKILKIDTEGFDFLVLKGAENALARGVFEGVQFEYNWRWLLNRASLRDVFSLVEGTPYRFGKLVGASIDFYDAWHFELDRFFENNYVLVRRDSPLMTLGRRVRFSSSNAAVTQQCGVG